MSLLASIISAFVALVLFGVGIMVGYTLGSIRRNEKNFEKLKINNEDIARLEFIAYSVRDEISSEPYSRIEKLIKEYKAIVEKVYQFK